VTELMNAWIVREAGEPWDVLHREAIPRPEPGPGEALIAVSACGLNFPDILQCQGRYHDKAPHPFSPGMEIVGTIAAADSLPVGQRVIAMPRLPHGGLAEYCIAPERDVFPIPDEIPDASAAGFLIVNQTAWLALHRRASVHSGETILIHGASGGVGTACVQIALAAGLRVITTVRSAAKAAAVESLGVDLVIDTTQTDFVSEVMSFTEGRGADVIIDPIGGETFRLSRRCIAWEGRIVAIGFMSNEIPDIAANQLLLKNFSVLGLNVGAYPIRHPAAMREAHSALVDLYLRGMINPAIHPLADSSDARSALRDLGEGKVIGKAIVFPFVT
jgi:NADPH2:quinone reductase